MADYNFSQSFNPQSLVPKFQYPEGEGNGITGLFSGLASGYQAGQQFRARLGAKREINQDFKDEFGSKATKQEMSNALEARGIPPGNLFTDFVGGVLGARGIGKMAENPMLGPAVEGQNLANKQARRNMSLEDTLLQNVGGLLQEFGGLSSTEERFNFLQKNAGLTVIPKGAQLFSQLTQLTGQIALNESRLLKTQVANFQAKDQAELITDYGADANNPESFIGARKKRAFAQIVKQNDGKRVLSKPPDDIYLPNGGLDPVQSELWLNTLPLNEATQQRLDMSQKRIENEALRMTLQRQGFGLREIDQMIRARELGYEIQGQPSIPGVSTGPALAPPVDPSMQGPPAPAQTAPAPGVTLKPIARPLTTANVTQGQRDLLAADSALASIDKSIDILRKNPDAAGIEGAVRELYEGIGGQLGLKPGTRITGSRTQLRDTANQLVVGLRVESGQMSNWERQMLEDIGNPLEWKLDAETAVDKLAVLRRLIGGRALRIGKILGQPPKPSALAALTREDLLEAVSAGYISAEQAIAEGERRP